MSRAPRLALLAAVRVAFGVGALWGMGTPLAGCATTATVTDLPASSSPTGEHHDHAASEPADPEISAEAYRSVLEAELKMQTGDVPAGIERLREAVLHDPGSPYLHVRLAEAYLESGDTEQARAAAQTALDLDKRYVPALRVVGAAWAAAGDAARARQAYDDALRAAPGDREASMLLAELQVEGGDLEGAERTIAALMAREPGAVDGYISLARIFAERGEVARAFAHVERALERENDDADALGLKLTLLWSLGRFDEGLPVARTWAAAAGDGPEVRRELLSAYALAGRVEDARMLATTWLDDDDSEGMRLLVADAWERAGLGNEALTVLVPPKSAPLSPRSAAQAAGLHLARQEAAQAAALICPLAALKGASGPVAEVAAATCAASLLHAGKPKDAAALVDERIGVLGKVARLLDVLPDLVEAGVMARDRVLVIADSALAATTAPAGALDVDVVDAAARIHEELGDVEGGRKIFDDALRVRPQDAELLFAYARHLDRQKQPLPAVEIVERLMDRGRRSLHQLNFAAFTLAEAGVRTDEARRYAWRALVQDPLNGYVVDTLGWCELANGDVDSAVITLRRADRLSPGEGEILFHLATAELRHGDPHAARDTAARAQLLLDVKDPVRLRVDALLESLRKAGS